MSLAAAIIAGVAALVAAGVSAGGASMTAEEEERERKKQMALEKERFDQQQTQVERQDNLSMLGRQKQRREIAKAATGPAWSGPTQTTKATRGGDTTTEPDATTKPSVAGSLVDAGTTIAGATISAIGANQQAKQDAAAASELSAMEQEQFKRKQAELVRSGNASGMDYLAAQRDEEKKRSTTKTFNKDLYKAWINVANKSGVK